MEHLTDEAKIEAWDLIHELLALGHSVNLSRDCDQWREWVEVSAHASGVAGKLGRNGILPSLRFIVDRAKVEAAKKPLDAPALP